MALADDWRSGFLSRQQQIQARVAELKNTLTNHRAERATLAETQRQEAAELRATLQGFHQDLAKETQEFRTNLANTQAEAAQAQKAALKSGHQDLAQQTHELLTGLNQTRALSTAQLRQTLAQGKADLENQTAERLGTLNSERAAFAEHLRTTLRQGRQNLAHQVWGQSGDFSETETIPVAVSIQAALATEVPPEPKEARRSARTNKMLENIQNQLATAMAQQIDPFPEPPGR